MYGYEAGEAGNDVENCQPDHRGGRLVEEEGQHVGERQHASDVQQEDENQNVQVGDVLVNLTHQYYQLFVGWG